MKDFTLKIYRELLIALQKADYNFYTFEDWCKGNAQGRYAILRHDVDLKAGNSLETAKIEAELGIRSSYYFRVVPQSNQPDIIRAIVELGHEIGYHYEDISLFNGDVEKSIVHFERQLSHFRQFYPVCTICMHGSPTSRWDNKVLWEKYDYRDYGIIGEPYFDMLNNPEVPNIRYLTDTARMWDGDKYNVRDRVGIHRANQPIGQRMHSTSELIRWLDTHPEDEVLMITTHPQRWTNNWRVWFVELISQTLKNRIKQIVRLLR